MPLIEDDDLTLGIEKLVTQESPESDISAGELIKAAFATENTIGSWIAKNGNMPDSVVTNPDFNPWDLLTEDERLDDKFLGHAMLADSEVEIEAVREQQRMEREARQTLENAGAWGFAASMAAAVADPVNLIPVGGTAYRTYKTGSSVLRAGMATGSVAATSTAAQEAGLHATQIERTLGESAMNVSSAFLLGGVLGGGASAIRNKINNPKIQTEVEDSFNFEQKIREGKDSVGAARVDDDIKVKGDAAEKLVAFFGKIRFDPLGAALTAKSQKARRLAVELAENPVEMEGGVPTMAVESLAKQYDGALSEAADVFYKELAEFRKRTGAGGLVDKVRGMSRKEFSEAVSRQMYNPDPSVHPEIKRAADAYRDKVYEPLKQRAVEAGLLPEDVDIKGDPEYLNRIWSKEKIEYNRKGFLDTVSNWLREQDQKLFSQIDEMRAKLKTLDPKKSAKEIEEIKARLAKAEYKEGLDLEELDYRDIAAQIADRITGTPDGRLPYDWKVGEGSKTESGGAKIFGGVNVKGPLRSRTFAIPTDDVREFVEQDIEVLASRYTRSMGMDVEMVAKFGDTDLKQQIGEIEADYGRMLEEAKSQKEIKKLKSERDNVIASLKGIRDRMRGQYGMVDPDSLLVRAGRSARDLNYLRFMGGVVASSIPDVARAFQAEGFAKVFGTSLKQLATNTKGFKMAADEVKAFNASANSLLGGRGEILADIADYTQGKTAFERGLHSMAQSFGKINLMDHWTAAMKQIHGVAMQTRIIDGILKGKPDFRRLNKMGLNNDYIKGIQKELKKHASKIDNVYLSNAGAWSDPELQRMWKAALRKESDRVIVMPGQEKPLWMSGEMGKTFFQFKSFMFSATQRMLIAGIQGQEANYFGGQLALITLGIMAYHFKQWDAGRPITDDPKALIIEGIDRSGSLGMLMEANNTLEKMSSNAYGLRPLFGVSAPASRFASRSMVEAAVGPTFGSLLDTTARVLNAGAADRPWTDSDTRALRRLLPYQNLMIMRQGFDKLEKTIQ